MPKINDKYQESYDVIADKMYDKYGEEIEDQDSFLEKYTEYMSKTDVKNRKDFQEGSFNAFLTSKNIPLTRRRIVAYKTKYGERDKKNFAKLKKQKIPSKRIIRQKGKRKKVYNYSFLAKQKGRTIYTRRITINYNKKVKKKTRLKSGVTATKISVIKAKRYAYIDKKGRRAKKI